MNTSPTIAEVITAASGRLARLTGTDYSLNVDLSRYGFPPTINVQVGHWLPDDDERLRVIFVAAQEISAYADWRTTVKVHSQGEDSGTLHRTATIDGIAWDVWAAMTLAETLAAERDRAAARAA